MEDAGALKVGDFYSGGRDDLAEGFRRDMEKGGWFMFRMGVFFGRKKQR